MCTHDDALSTFPSFTSLTQPATSLLESSVPSLSNKKLWIFATLQTSATIASSARMFPTLSTLSCSATLWLVATTSSALSLDKSQHRRTSVSKDGRVPSQLNVFQTAESLSSTRTMMEMIFKNFHELGCRIVFLGSVTLLLKYLTVVPTWATHPTWTCP